MQVVHASAEDQAADTALISGAERLARENVMLPGDVLCVVSDDRDFAELMKQAREKWGMACVAVCRQRLSYPGADVTLDWDRIEMGSYDLGRQSV